MATAINQLSISILELINNIIKIAKDFSNKPDLTSLFTALTAVNTYDTESCTSVEGNNVVNLITNMTSITEQCFSNYDDTVTTVNLVANLSEIISKVTEETKTCLQNANFPFDIMKCIATPFENITQIVTQLITTVVPVIVGLVGIGISHTTICIKNMATEFVKGYLIIITDFSSCLDQL